MLDYPNLPIRDTTIENHLIGKGINCRICYSKEKIKTGSFNSDYLLEVVINETNLHRAKISGIAKIEHIIEVLNITLHSKEKILGGKIRSRETNDFYYFRFIGVYIKKNGYMYKIKVPILTTSVNFFPEVMNNEFKNIIKDILKCNDPIFIKLTKYLKRAKKFSYDHEHFSELEVFFNSIKCIELLANKFYPKGGKKAKIIIKSKKGNYEREMYFMEKIIGVDNSLNDKVGVGEKLNIDDKYLENVKKAWETRNKIDFAHANEYDKLLPTIYLHKVNETAYHFVFKYVQYLKKNKPESFWSDDNVLKEDEWWSLFE